MNIYITRHGQTDWNVLLKLQGRTDILLNSEGRSQAQSSAQGLKDAGIYFDKVYSSPLKRAFETACIMSGFEKEKVIKDARIVELAFGIAEGTTPDERSKSHDYDWFNDFFEAPHLYKAGPGAESFASSLKRTADFWENEIKPLEGSVGNILISTHGAALQSLLLYVDGRSLEDYWKVRFPNCSVNLISCNNGKLKVEWNSRVFY